MHLVVVACLKEVYAIGADEVHDTVLIAAAFCMFNRYVDGLATWAPDDESIYDQIGAQRATQGYLAPAKPLA